MYYPRSPPYPLLSHQDLWSSGRSSLSPGGVRSPSSPPRPSVSIREVGVRLPGESSWRPVDKPARARASPPNSFPASPHFSYSPSRGPGPGLAPAPALLRSPSGESPANAPALLRSPAKNNLRSGPPPRSPPPAPRSLSLPGQENEEGMKLSRKPRRAQLSAAPPPASGGEPLAPAAAEPSDDAIANLRTKIIGREKAAQVAAPWYTQGTVLIESVVNERWLLEAGPDHRVGKIRGQEGGWTGQNSKPVVSADDNYYDRARWKIVQTDSDGVVLIESFATERYLLEAGPDGKVGKIRGREEGWTGQNNKSVVSADEDYYDRARWKIVPGDTAPQSPGKQKAATPRASLLQEGFVEDLPPRQEQELSWSLEGQYCGTQVKIHGLQAKPELNDQVGFAVSYDETTGRYNVKVPDGSTTALQPKNLEPVAGDNPRSIGVAAQNSLMSTLRDLQGMRDRKTTENAAENVADEQKVDVFNFLMSKFEPEAQVELHSLRAEENNGKRGRLVSYNTETGRWLVELGDGVFFKLKPANLRVVEVKTCDDDQLQVGQMVEFHSLMHSPHFNGSQGQLSQFDPETGCWLVTLDDGQIAALKPDNLRPVGRANCTPESKPKNPSSFATRDMPDSSFNESLLEDTSFNERFNEILRKENDVINRLRRLKVEHEDDNREYWARTPDYSFPRASTEDYSLPLDPTAYIPRNNALDLNSESSLSPAIVLEPKVGFSRLTLEERGVARPVISPLSLSAGREDRGVARPVISARTPVARSTSYPLDVRAV